MDAKQELAQEVRNAIAGSGMTLKAIAQAINRNTATVSRYKSGEIAIDPAKGARLVAVTEYADGRRLVDLALAVAAETEERRTLPRIEPDELKALQRAVEGLASRLEALESLHNDTCHNQHT